MKAKLYIDSEDSTIKIEGSPSDVLHLLVCAIAQILKSYFPTILSGRWAGRLDCSTTRSAR